MVKKLTAGDPKRLIWGFTWPLILGNMFQQLYAFVDTFMVGRFLGVNALASVGSTGALMFLVLGFVNGFTTGLSIVTGQRFGARDRSGVRESAATGVIVSVVFGVFLTILCCYFCRDILIAMYTPEEIIDGAYDFIIVVYGGMLAFVLLNLQINLLRALGDSKTPTYILAATLTLNIIFEPIAILVLHGGIFGAALATILAQILGNIMIAWYIHKKVPHLHTRYTDWIPKLSNIWEHIKIAFPMGFQLSVIAIGAVILQVALNNLGPVAIAAYAAAQKVDAVALMPMTSFGMAMAAYTAQNFGAGNYLRVKQGITACSKMSVGFAIVAGIVLALFGHYVMELFVGPNETQVIEYGRLYLIINGLNFWLVALLFVFRAALQGLGKTFAPTITGIMELVMRAGVAIYLAPILGYLGACFANPAAWVGGLIPLLIAYYFVKKELNI